MQNIIDTESRSRFLLIEFYDLNDFERSIDAIRNGSFSRLLNYFNVGDNMAASIIYWINTNIQQICFSNNNYKEELKKFPKIIKKLKELGV